MILHIFRKDALLLWPLVMLVTVLHAIAATLLIVTGRFGEPENLRSVANILVLIEFIAMGVLIVTVLHQDAIPGVRQDWLVRPVRRRDLISAKLLFAVVLVIGPLVAVDLGRGWIEGFSLSASLAAAATHGASVMAMIGSISLIIGAITRNAMQALVAAAIGATIIFGLAAVIEQVLFVGAGLMPTSLHWLLSAGWKVVAVLAALVVLPLQYFRRQTKFACGIATLGVAAATLLPWLPWQTAFALQQSLRDPAPAAAIAVNFDPASGRVKPDAGLVLPVGLTSVLQTVSLPVEINGLGAGNRLKFDGVDVRVVDANNKVLYHDSHNLSVFGGGSMFERKPLEILSPEPGAASSRAYSSIWLFKADYDQFKKLDVRLELEYSLTLMQAGPAYAIAALALGQKVPGLGVCDTRIDRDGDEIEAACTTAQNPPDCFSAFLQQSTGNLKNTEFHSCNPQYGKDPQVMGAFWRFGGGVPFRDLTGQARYAVDGTKLDGAQIVINSFVPKAHFTRKVVIASIRLAEWERAANVTPQ